MSQGDFVTSRGMPLLLSRLASSIDATASYTATRNEDRNRHHRRPTKEGQALCITRLRRAYNILLFDSASYEEAIEQAEVDDNHLATLSRGYTTWEDEVADAAASLSAASFALRRARRYDPANALESLADFLMIKHGPRNALFIARVLRLLMALSDVESQNVDDYLLVGCHGRRLLKHLYNNANLAQRAWQGGNSVILGRSGGRGCVSSSLPVSMFFRGGREIEPQHYPDIAEDVAPSTQERAFCWGSTEPHAPSPATRSDRFALPTDNILYDDSSTDCPANRTKDFGFGRMPWLTAEDCSSERGFLNMSKNSSLDRCLSTVIQAPLSPTAWMKRGASTAGGEIASSFSTGISGGLPVAPVEKEDDDHAVHDGVGQVGVRGFSSNTVGLYGALHPSRSGMNPQSPVVRELRIALSLPELEDTPKSLLDAMQLDLGSSMNSRNLPHRSSDPAGHDATALSGAQISQFRPPWSKGGTEHYIETRKQSQLSFAKANSKAPLKHASKLLRGSETNDIATIIEKGAAFCLEPVGWESAEAERNDPAVARSTLVSGPLATSEGGADFSAFEVCYRQHFDEVQGEAWPPVIAEAEMVRRALAAMQGVPSETFGYDEQRACIQVLSEHGREALRREGIGSDIPPYPPKINADPRIAGLSSDALVSMLEEFATSGSWYRRVEEFSGYLMDGSCKAGQVAQALGVELRQQILYIEARLLAIAAGVSDSGHNPLDAKRAMEESEWRGDREKCSLTELLQHTKETRRAIGILAEICNLVTRDLYPLGGVRGVFERFPRGAPLLSYLYKVAEVSIASKSEVRGVKPGKDLALALLGSAASPYLAMLSTWLWSGDLREEDDPFGEFPLYCRGVQANSCSSESDTFYTEAPWMRDGGNNFMAEGFCENTEARIPCFLDGGVLARATRAGKFLHMLKFSSQEFYASCAASPPPPLSLVFDSHALMSRETVFSCLSQLQRAACLSAEHDTQGHVGGDLPRKGPNHGIAKSDALVVKNKLAMRMLEAQRERDLVSALEARKTWVQALENDRSAAAAATAAAEPSPSKTPPTSFTDRGILSFLEAPTSEAECLAADALLEKYRQLCEEADTRGTRARWIRQRRERATATREALKVLYAAETQHWKTEVEASRTAGRTWSTEKTISPDNESVDGNHRDVEAPVSEGQKISYESTPSVSPSEDGSPLPALAAAPVPVPREISGVASENHEEKNNGAEKTTSTRQSLASSDPSVIKTESQSSPPRITRYRPWDVPETNHNSSGKFSHVTIVQEPGGGSAGVASALGVMAMTDRSGVDSGQLNSEGFKSEPFLKFSHVKIVREPGGKSLGVSQALGAEVNEERDNLELRTFPRKLGVRRRQGLTRSAGEERQGLQHLSSHLTITQEPSVMPESISLAIESGGPSTSPVGQDRGAHPGAGASHPQLRSTDDRPAPPVLHGVPTPSSYAPSRESADDDKGAPGVDNARTDAGNIHPAYVDQRERDGKGACCSEDRSEGNREKFSKIGQRQEAPGLARVKNDRAASARSEREYTKEKKGRRDDYFHIPLELIVRRCVREPVLAQCEAVDSAAITFLVRRAGAMELLISLRMFLLGLDSTFLHDFTQRLLEGLYDGVDWRRPSNLNAAFSASATAVGLESVPLFETFRYEVDSTCGGILESVDCHRKLVRNRGVSRQDLPGKGGQISKMDEEENVAAHEEDAKRLERYSPAALAFVHPVLAVKWPLGVLLPAGALHNYAVVHRALFKHHVAVHRLRRLRLVLRELDLAMGPQFGRVHDGKRQDSEMAPGSITPCDRSNLHWLHLFRHDMQHMADTLQTFFAEQAEVGWPDLRRSLISPGETKIPGHHGVSRRGRLADLAAAHSRYISEMCRNMFVGCDRQGMIARTRIDEFYNVVCAVGRATDGLPLVTSSSQSQEEWLERPGDAKDQKKQMVFPPEATTELRSLRVRFDTARRGLCKALSDIDASGDGTRIRPLLDILGYGCFE